MQDEVWIDFVGLGKLVGKVEASNHYSCFDKVSLFARGRI